MIDVWGADHGGYVKRMKAAVAAVSGGEAELDVKLCQLVRLLRGGEPVKMSKRAGDFVTLREVVDEVGRDAVRFMMLFRKNDATLDFDLAEGARAVEGQPGLLRPIRACPLRLGVPPGARGLPGRGFLAAARSREVDLAPLATTPSELGLIAPPRPISAGRRGRGRQRTSRTASLFTSTTSRAPSMPCGTRAKTCRNYGLLIKAINHRHRQGSPWSTRFAACSRRVSPSLASRRPTRCDKDRVARQMAVARARSGGRVRPTEGPAVHGSIDPAPRPRPRRDRAAAEADAAPVAALEERSARRARAHRRPERSLQSPCSAPSRQRRPRRPLRGREPLRLRDPYGRAPHAQRRAPAPVTSRTGSADGYAPGGGLRAPADAPTTRLCRSCSRSSPAARGAAS